MLVPPIYLSVVTPYAGVWIEILTSSGICIPHSVTPYAGVWIEIMMALPICSSLRASLPTRECGLKFADYFPGNLYLLSLPTRECGLKLKEAILNEEFAYGHSLRGSVD